MSSTLIRNLTVRLGIEFDDKGVNKLTKGLDNVAGRIKRTSSSMDRMRTPALAVGMASAAASASSLAVALVPATASMVAMPAAMAASKVAAGTLKIAMIGVGDAMSAIAEGDAKKLEESLEKLSPQAQKFVKASAGFMKGFEPIRKAVQDRLFEHLDKGIAPVAKNLLPTAEKGMLRVASAFNRGAREAISFGGTPIAKGALNTVFKLTKDVLTDASTAVKPFLGAVARLVTLGAPLARQMASWVINGVKAGAAFVSSERGAAKLSAWAERAGATLKRLGSIGKNLAVGLVGTFSQANTGSMDLLGTLERMTAKFAAWSKSAEGQQQAANVFKLLGDVARQLAVVLPLLLGPLGAVAKVIASLPPDVQGTVSTMLAFGVVAGALGGKLATVGSVAVKATSGIIQFGGGLVRGASALGNNATMAARAGAAMRTFGGHMVTGINATVRMVTHLSALAGAWLLNTTRMVASKVAMIAANVASKAMAAGIWLVNIALRANPIGIVITVIMALVAVLILAYKKSDTFRKIVDTAWRVIVGVVKWAWNTVILPVFKLILNYYKMLWQAAVWLYERGIKPAWNLIARGISVTWKSVIKPVFDFMVKLLLRTIPDAFRSGVKSIGTAWNKLKEVAKIPVSFVVNTVYNKGIARMWNWVADKVGLGKLPYIQGFARGGILPGQDTGRDNQLIMARSGEGILVPEAVRGLGERFVHNTNAAANAGGASAVARMIAGDPGGLGIPGFQNGGIVGLVRSFFAKGKEYFVNGFIRAAKAALGPIVATTRGAIGGTPFGQLLVAAVEKIVNGVLNRLKPYESELGGGPGMKAVNAARSQIGVPYSWGGGGPGGPGYGFAQGANIRGFDCSSLMQYAWYKATGKVIPRTTFAQKPWLDRISSPRPGAIGQPHPGHTYMATGKGTLVEAPYTGARVREVGMRSTPYWGWPGKLFDDGGVWEPGTFGYNGSGRPEYVFNDRQMRGMGGRGDTYNMTFQVSPGTDVREFEDAVYRALKGYKKRNRNAEI